MPIMLKIIKKTKNATKNCLKHRIIPFQKYHFSMLTEIKIHVHVAALRTGDRKTF